MKPKLGLTPSFPELRWPSQEEAELNGYRTLEDWYLDSRAGDSTDPALFATLRAEFKQHKHWFVLGQRAEEEIDVAVEAEAVEAAPGGRCSSGTAETGPSMVAQLWFADNTPLAVARMDSVYEVREALVKVLKEKWRDASQGEDPVPTRALMDGTNVRSSLRAAFNSA